MTTRILTVLLALTAVAVIATLAASADTLVTGDWDEYGDAIDGRRS